MDPVAPVTLRADSVVLRPHTDGDIDLIVDQCNDPQSRAYTTLPEPYTREHAEIWLREKVRKGWQLGQYLSFAIADAQTDEFLGSIGLHDDGSGAPVPREIGYGLRATARGRGAAANAVRTLAEWARMELGLQTVLWRARVGNWPSRRVAWATGFRIDGRVRDFSVVRGIQSAGWIGTLRAEDPLTPAHPWFEPVRLTDGTVALREFRESDATSVVEGCNDEQTRHWLGHLPQPYDKDDALTYIRDREEEHASGHGLYWAMADPMTDRCIGSFGFGINLETGAAEVGYWVHPDARGRGIATSALRLAIRHAAIPVEDGGLGLRRLILRAAVGNVGSQRVAERAGFEPVGIERGFGLLGDGSYADHLLYDRLL